MRQFLFAAIAMMALSAPAPSYAQEADRVLCFSLGNENYKDKEKFKAGEDACTRMIKAGTFRDKALASIYRARGSWHQKQGELDLSLADYAVAIKMEPKNVESLTIAPTSISRRATMTARCRTTTAHPNSIRPIRPRITAAA